jgi:hypothetical protein
MLFDLNTWIVLGAGVAGSAFYYFRYIHGRNPADALDDSSDSGWFSGFFSSSSGDSSDSGGSEGGGGGDSGGGSD